MICPKRLTELIQLHVAPFNEKDPSWDIRASKIADRGVFATRNIKRGEVIFHENPLLIGPAVPYEDDLKMCTICYTILDEAKFMCRKGCGLPVCTGCSKKKQHTAECELFRSWEPNEPHLANSTVIRLLAVARALLLTKEQQDLIYSLQANLDNNHRSEVRTVAKCFRKFPTDKRIIEIINLSVALIKANGFDPAKPDKGTDNEEFPHRALFPLFGILNHECVPNITYSFDENTYVMTVKAALDIPEGRELTTTYTRLFSNNIARHQYLKLKKLFICKCTRCSDPTENGSFISALYCRNTQCTGLVVPESKDLPHPNWNCLVCKQKSSHTQMLKSQDFASGALSAKLNAVDIKAIIEYINDKCDSFIPPSNYIVIDAKLQVIAKLRECKDQYTDEEYKNKKRYCNDILGILDKLGVGDCPMRKYLDTEKLN